MQSNRVNWAEGLFLKPQHFQQQERYFEYSITQKYHQLGDHLWGIKTLSFNQELLQQGKLALDSASGFFADGTGFNFPNCDCSPDAITIPNNTKNQIVYLALPVIKHNEYHQRYSHAHLNLLDQSTNDFDCDDIEIAKIKPILKLSSHELDNYLVIPLAKITECRTDNSIQLDSNFIPTAIQTQAFAKLAQMAVEILELLNHRSHALSQRLTDVEQSATAEITDFMLLQLVNRYEAVFFDLTNTAVLHPRQLYQALIQLLSELSTFTNDKRRVANMCVYNHQDLATTFMPLMHQLRHELSTVLVQSAVAITLEPRGAGIFVGIINEKSLLDDCHFILAISADIPSETLRKTLPSQIKIAPVEQLHNLVMRSLPGIEIENLAIAPRQIPYHSNFLYFQINKQHSLWQSLPQSAALALHLTGLLPGLKLELWAVRG